MKNILKKKKIRYATIAILAIVMLIGAASRLHIESGKAGDPSAAASSSGGEIVEGQESLETGDSSGDAAAAAQPEGSAASGQEDSNQSKQSDSGKSKDAASNSSDSEKDVDSGIDAEAGMESGAVTSGSTSTKSGSSSNKTATKKRKSNTVKKSSSKKKATATPKATAKPADSDGKITVSLEIRCDTLAKNPDKLKDSSLKVYVPSNGTILAKTSYKCDANTSVYEVLYNICRTKSIHLASEYTAMYGSRYIKGINHLYEFNAGTYSGWIYKVNGRFPDEGCSDYKLSNGDAIVWAYTCEDGDVKGSGL